MDGPKVVPTGPCHIPQLRPPSSPGSGGVLGYPLVIRAARGEASLKGNLQMKISAFPENERVGEISQRVREKEVVGRTGSAGKGHDVCPEGEHSSGSGKGKATACRNARKSGARGRRQGRSVPSAQCAGGQSGPPGGSSGLPQSKPVARVLQAKVWAGRRMASPRPSG